MEFLENVVTTFNDGVWTYILPWLLIGAGLLFGARTAVVQIRKVPDMLRAVVERPKTDGPDYEVIEALVKKLDGDRPVIAEGRIHTPDQARRAMDLGAHAVVVGTAITHPTSITGWFRDALR